MRFLCFALLSLLALPADAGAACPSEEPVVDRWELWDFSASPRMDFYLPSRNSFGGYLTSAAAHVEWFGQLQISFDHYTRDGQVWGNPYYVHRIQLDVGEYWSGDQFSYVDDLSMNCTGFGLPIPLQASRKLLPVNVPTHANGKPRGIETVRVRIWGKHI